MKKILLINFLMLTLFNFIHPITPELLASKNQGIYLNGYLYSCMALATFIFSPIWSKYVNKIGIKKLMIIGPIGYSFVQIGLLITNNQYFLMISRFFAGVFSSMFVIAITILINNLSEKEEKSKNFALITATTSLGAIVGQIISGYIGLYSIKIPFILLIILMIVLTIYINTLEIKKITNYENQKNNENYLNINQNILLNIIIFIVFTLIANIYNSNISSYSRLIFHANSFMIGVIVSIGNFILLFVNLFLIDKIKKYNYQKYLFLITMISFVGSFGCFIFKKGIIFIIFMCLLVLSFTTYKAIIQAHLINNNSKDANKIIGILNSINGIGMITGGFVSGTVFSINANLVFILLIFLSILGIIIVLMKKNDL